MVLLIVSVTDVYKAKTGKRLNINNMCLLSVQTEFESANVSGFRGFAFSTIRALVTIAMPHVPRGELCGKATDS